MLHSVSEKCKNLDSFVFDYAEKTSKAVFIGFFGKRIKKVYFRWWINPETVLSSSLHCASIRKLTQSVEIKHLEGLNLWRTVGNSLEFLSMETDSSAEDKMLEI